MSIEYSARGSVRDIKPNRCWYCDSADIHGFTIWTPPSELGYFHPTKYVRHYCAGCNPDHTKRKFYCTLGHLSCTIC